MDIDPQLDELEQLVEQLIAPCEKPVEFRVDAQAIPLDAPFAFRLKIVDKMQCHQRHADALQEIRDVAQLAGPDGLPPAFEAQYRERRALSTAILARRPDGYAATCLQFDYSLGESFDELSLMLKCHSRASVMYRRAQRLPAAASELRAARAVLVRAKKQPEATRAEFEAELLTREAAALFSDDRPQLAAQKLIEAIRVRMPVFLADLAAKGPEDQRRVLASSSNPERMAAVLKCLPFQFPDVPVSVAISAALFRQSFSHLLGTNTWREARSLAARADFRSLSEARHHFAALVFGPRTVDHAAELSQVYGEIRRYEQRLQREQVDASPSPAPTTQEIAQALGPSDAFVHYVSYFRLERRAGRSSGETEPQKRTDRRYGAYVVTPGIRDGVAIDLGPAAGIDDAVRAYRTLLDDQNRHEPTEPEERALAAVGAKLRELLFDPVRSRIPATKRYYLKDEQLARIPFDALPEKVRPSVEYLAEKLEFVHLNGPRTLSAERMTTGSGKVWLVASPDYGPAVYPAEDSGSPELAAHEHWSERNSDELQSNAKHAAIRSGLQLPVLTGSNASEASVLGITSPRGIVFSTHGQFLDESMEFADPNPETPEEGHLIVSDVATPNALLQSFLVLANANRRSTTVPSASFDDGILTAYEVLGMDLRGTELVLLATCQSGLAATSVGRTGTGHAWVFDATSPGTDDVRGLPGAFLRAGAQAVVYALWSIPQLESQRAAEDLLDAWLGERLPPFVAFRRSLLAALARARKTRGCGHPLWWAGWTFGGAPGG